MSRLSWLYGPLLAAISDASMRRLIEFSPQSITTTAWALAKLLLEDWPLLAAISAESIRKCEKFEPPDISTTAWALATMVLLDAPLLAAISSAALRTMAKFDGVEISITAWSCARLRWAHPPLLNAMSSAALAKLHDFGAQEIGNTAWAVSVFKFDDGTLLAALAARFRAACWSPAATTCASGTSSGGGVEWVEVVSALVIAACGGRQPRGGVALELEEEFARRYFWPVATCVADLAARDVPHAVAYRAISQTVDRLGTAHFGSPHTRLALPAVARSRPPPPRWAADARAAIRSALAGRVGAGTTERCVVYSAAFLAWRDDIAELPGAVYGSLPRGPPAPIGESPEDRARALLRHVHRHILRDNHAERAALLEVTAEAVRLSGDGEGGEALAECVGEVRIYASHVPCVSCVAAGAQFSRFLPMVHLDFEFEDAWRQRPDTREADAVRARHEPT